MAGLRMICSGVAPAREADVDADGSAGASGGAAGNVETGALFRSIVDKAATSAVGLGSSRGLDRQDRRLLGPGFGPGDGQRSLAPGGPGHVSLASRRNPGADHAPDRPSGPLRWLARYVRAAICSARPTSATC